MKNITVKWNIGNYEVELETLVDESIVEDVIAKGVLQIAQRQSQIDKVLGIVNSDGKPVLVNGKRIKRNEVDYDENKATELARVFESMKAKSETKEGVTFELSGSASVGEYTSASAKEPAFAYEKKLLKAKLAAGQSYAISAANIKYEGQLVDDDGEPTTDFAKALKAYLSATAF